LRSVQAGFAVGKAVARLRAKYVDTVTSSPASITAVLQLTPKRECNLEHVPMSFLTSCAAALTSKLAMALNIKGLVSGCLNLRPFCCCSEEHEATVKTAVGFTTPKLVARRVIFVQSVPVAVMVSAAVC
jgi:hypothetical protein